MVYIRVLMRGLGTTRFLYNMPSYAIYRNQNDNMNKEYQGIFGNIFVVRRSMGHSGRESTLNPRTPIPRSQQLSRLCHTCFIPPFQWPKHVKPHD